MDFRHTMKGRRALSAVAITAGLLLTVAALRRGRRRQVRGRSVVVTGAEQQ